MSFTQFSRCSTPSNLLPRTISTCRRLTAGLHTQCSSLKAKEKQKEVMKKMDSFDYMSKLRDFDSLKSFQRPEREEKWKHEENIILFSLACFCIHFFILREENQFDETMAQPLYTTIPALELIDLTSRITELKAQRKDFSQELARLEELKKEIEEKEIAEKAAKM